RKVRPGLSAGRVQSAALKLLVDRERAIEQFTPVQYFTVQGIAEAADPVAFQYVGPLGEKGRIDKAQAEKVAEAVPAGEMLQVKAVKTKERKRLPAMPFTTSTLQQEASRRLGFAVRRTMRIAQQLYEGLEVKKEGTVGLITYIRTDSTRIADSAKSEAKEYIAARFGEKHIAEEKGGRKASAAKIGVQDAHEAIRPTLITREPEAIKADLTRDQWKLYKLIWERFVASQMAAEIYDATTVDLEAHGHLFRAHGSRVKFRGFTELYQESVEETAGDSEKSEALEDHQATLPAITEGTSLPVRQIALEEHWTEPPARFSEASLVHTLEELGIGRPSTYAPIIDTLLQRTYVERDQKRLLPTELGEVVVDLLAQYFPEIVSTNFTADVEHQLDLVASAQMAWQTVLMQFYDPFVRELHIAEEDISKIMLPEETTDEVCD
ncbi:MAG: type I DNA topoisomerase, partial [Firmicutes bacterium]|nr:type I DNA topoisomerase [Bacillota bacterium]